MQEPGGTLLSHAIKHVRQSTPISYRQFHVTPIPRSVFISGRVNRARGKRIAHRVSSPDMLWPVIVAQWSRKGDRRTSTRCRLTDARSIRATTPAGPPRPRLHADQTNPADRSQKIQIPPAHAWAGRGRVQRTVVLGQDTGTGHVPAGAGSSSSAVIAEALCG